MRDDLIPCPRCHGEVWLWDKRARLWIDCPRCEAKGWLTNEGKPGRFGK